MSASLLYGTPPAGGVSAFVQTADNVRVRVAYWKAAQDNARTILFIQGRTEFIEKYYPIAERYLALGYNIAMVDLRGQGRSQRAQEGLLTGHVEHFDEYQRDVDAALEWLHGMDVKPTILAAHSLGGCVAVTRLLRDPAPFERALLSAPMLGIAMPAPLLLIGPYLSSFLTTLGAGKSAPPGMGKITQADMEFENNPLTHSRERFDVFVKLIRDYPDLGVSGPSWRWLGAAMKAMKAIADAPRNSLTIPTLLTMPEEESIVRNVMSQRFAERQDAVTLFPLAGSRHEPYQEADPAYETHWARIKQFLEGKEDDG